MKKMPQRPNLRLINGGKSVSYQPVSMLERLDLDERIEPISSRMIAFMIFGKFALLAAVVAYFWS